MNKVVLITGSSRGIGKAIALRFASEGYDIILNASKSNDSLKQTCSEVEQLGVQCTPILCDVSDYTKVEEMFNKIYSEYESIDVLVNNAGISHVSLFTDLKECEWDSIININLKSVYNCCHFALPKMIYNKSGCIINISSMWGISGASCEVAYSASKGGMNALTKALAKELGPSNIRVNAIACGVIDTAMNNWLDDDERVELTEEIPLMRFGKASEVADLCIYLSSNNSTYLTGQVIPLDGGLL